MATETELGDRLHLLNELFAENYNKTAPRKLATRRTWPQNYMTAALWPFLCPLPGDMSNYGQFPQAGAGAAQPTKYWTLILIVGAFELGIPTETVQLECENLIQQLFAFYNGKKNLLVRTKNGMTLPQLQGLVKAEIRRGRGIVPMGETAIKLATLQFPVEIVTLEALDERVY